MGHPSGKSPPGWPAPLGARALEIARTRIGQRCSAARLVWECFREAAQTPQQRSEVAQLTQRTPSGTWRVLGEQNGGGWCWRSPSSDKSHTPRAEPGCLVFYGNTVAIVEEVAGPLEYRAIGVVGGRVARAVVHQAADQVRGFAEVRL